MYELKKDESTFSRASLMGTKTVTVGKINVCEVGLMFFRKKGETREGRTHCW
jgi:hypothetical protein